VANFLIAAWLQPAGSDDPGQTIGVGVVVNDHAQSFIILKLGRRRHRE
jgi:hypothetical protein